MKILLLFALGFATFAAEPKSHSIDFTQKITTLDGKPMPGSVDKDGKPGPAVTLGDVAVMALESSTDEDKTATGEQKFKLDSLARKCYQAKAAVLSVEELATLKARIAKVYGPMVVGASWRLLDPSTDQDK